MTTALHMFALIHVAQATLLAETIACEEFKRIAVISRNKDTQFALEGQSQCMQQQSLSIFHCTGNPGAERAGLCDKIAGDPPIGVAYDQSALRVVGPIRGEDCVAIGTEARSVERDQRWYVFLTEDGDAFGQVLRQQNTLRLAQDHCLIVFHETIALVEWSANRSRIKQH